MKTLKFCMKKSINKYQISPWMLSNQRTTLLTKFSKSMKQNIDPLLDYIKQMAHIYNVRHLIN